MSEPRWCLLIHQLPPRPLYLRAKIRQRLATVGAVVLKKSVYVLPRSEDAVARLRHIAEEARAGGGEAFVWEADFAGPGSEEDLVASFRRQRTADYESLGAHLRTWRAGLDRRMSGAAPEGALRARLALARRRLDALCRIDFFDAPGRSGVEAALADLEGRFAACAPAPATARNRDLVGRTWVTRRGVQVDRIASAWFVRRFVDPRARFRFVDPGADPVRPGEVRFDMAGGDFSHEQDRCTLETLVARTGVRDPALARVAQIVHDIDIKDGKFGHPEARGVEQILLGLLRAHGEDEARLERGFALLDDLHQSFLRRPQPRPPERGAKQ